MSIDKLQELILEGTIEQLIEDALKSFDECDTGDTECAHGMADDVLCKFLISLGFDDIVKRYDAVHKWYA